MCDNLRVHKCTEVLKVMQEDKVELLFLPSYSPEFSAIESLFRHLKSNLKDVLFKIKEDLADKITRRAKETRKEDI